MGERGDGDRCADAPRDAGTEDSMDDIVGGPLLDGRVRGTVWRKEHFCP